MMEMIYHVSNLRKIDHLGAQYDTCSVMHYGAYAFAKVILLLVFQEYKERSDQQ